MEINKKSVIIIFLFLFYIGIELIFYDKIVALISNSNLFISIILYIIFNPAYVTLIYASYKLSQKYGKAVYKRAIGSILITLSFMMIEFPRIALSESLKNGSATITNMGAIIMSRLDILFPHTISFYLYYLIIPFILFFLGLEHIGITNFIKKMNNGGM